VIQLLDSRGVNTFKYVVAGAFTGVMSLVLLTGFVEGLDWNPVAANVVQWVVTTYLNFVLICKWVFKTNPHSWVLITENYGARAFTFVLVHGLFATMTRAGLWYGVAYVVSAGVGFLVNYLLTKDFVFRQQRKEML
jgi:putative flippase GtrA